MEFSKRDLLNDTAIGYISFINIYVFLEYIYMYTHTHTDCFFLRVTNNTMITCSRDLDRTFWFSSTYLEHLYDLVVCNSGNENTRIRVWTNIRKTWDFIVVKYFTGPQNDRFSFFYGRSMYIPHEWHETFVTTGRNRT